MIQGEKHVLHVLPVFRCILSDQIRVTHSITVTDLTGLFDVNCLLKICKYVSDTLELYDVYISPLFRTTVICLVLVYFIIRTMNLILVYVLCFDVRPANKK